MSLLAPRSWLPFGLDPVARLRDDHARGRSARGVRPGPRGGTMASTNENAVLLATRPSDDGRLLIMRHLPDRGTIEIGWWDRDGNGAVVQGPPVLELAAEAVEVGAVARLCEWLVGAGWDDTAVEGRGVAGAPPPAHRAHGDGV